VADLGRPSLRAGLLLALAVVALFDVLSLVQGLRASRRLRARAEDDATRAVETARPRIEAALAAGGPEAWNAAMALALELGPAREAEIVDRNARSLLSRPTPPPVVHAPRATERARLEAGATLTAVARTGPSLRVLVYLPFTERGERLALRLALAAPDLVEETREREQVALGQLASLGALCLAAVLALALPGRSRVSATPSALAAYEQAMGRLRDRGQEMTRRHEEERRRLEDEIREKDTMARAGELTAGMVHEVRNGLGTIVGYARLLEKAPLADADAEAVLGIRKECEVLEAVVRRFTDFVRQETLQLGEVDLRRLLERVAARELRGRAHVRLSLDALPARVPLRGDEGLLERAFENLLRNAAEAAAEGGGHVWIAAEPEGDGLELAIADDGAGLANGHDGVIRPFYTTKPGGLGLGLPTARKLVRLHGGELRLERRAPRGLRVVVRLPLAGPDV
jgi:signal transduction histidine kinase